LAQAAGLASGWQAAGGRIDSERERDKNRHLIILVLLANVAIRSGERTEWQPDEMKIPNLPSAERYLKREYRDGWEL
jgi:hypothetical protein